MFQEAFQTGKDRYQPTENLSEKELIDQERIAFLVGLVAMGLPTVTILAGVFLTTCLYDSLSHFYFAPFWGAVFVGCVIFIAAYLLAFQGNCCGERQLANLGAPFAAMVALFPTSGAGCTEAGWPSRVFADLTYHPNTDTVSAFTGEEADLFSLFGLAGVLHLAAAGILFLILSWFALRVFTRIVPHRDLDDEGQIKPEKRQRNRIYRICGIVMLICIGLIAAHFLVELVTGRALGFWDRWNLTLILEAIALYAFGYCWMVKGRFLGLAYLDETPLRASS